MDDIMTLVDFGELDNDNDQQLVNPLIIDKKEDQDQDQEQKREQEPKKDVAQTSLKVVNNARVRKENNEGMLDKLDASWDELESLGEMRELKSSIMVSLKHMGMYQQGPATMIANAKSLTELIKVIVDNFPDAVELIKQVPALAPAIAKYAVEEVKNGAKLVGKLFKGSVDTVLGKETDEAGMYNALLAAAGNISQDGFVNNKKIVTASDISWITRQYFMWPLFPFVNFNVGMGLHVYLGKIFEMPDFTQMLDNNYLHVRAGLKGGVKLNLDAGLSEGLIGLAELTQFIRGELSAQGSDNDFGLLTGTLDIAEECIDWEESGKENRFVVRPPSAPTRMVLKGGINLAGALKVAFGMRSVLMGLHKTLYAYKIGQWNLAKVDWQWTLERDGVFPSMFQGWRVVDSQRTYTDSAGVVYDAVKSASLEEQSKNVQELVSAGERTKESYDKIVAALAALKSGGTVVAKGSDAVKGVIDEADKLLGKMKYNIDNIEAQTVFLNNFIKTHRNLSIYKSTKGAADKQKKLHEDRLAALSVVKDRNRNRKDSKDAKDEISKLDSWGYTKWLMGEAGKRMYVFRDNAAYLYHKRKAEKPAGLKRGGIKGFFKKLFRMESMESLLTKKYTKLKEQDPAYGKSPDADFFEFYRKQVNDDRELVKGYADRTMILQYEQERLAAKRTKAIEYIRGEKKDRTGSEVEPIIRKIAKDALKRGEYGWLFTESRNPINRLMQVEEKNYEESNTAMSEGKWYNPKSKSFESRMRNRTASETLKAEGKWYDPRTWELTEKIKSKSGDKLVDRHLSIETLKGLKPEAFEKVIALATLKAEKLNRNNKLARKQKDFMTLWVLRTQKDGGADGSMNAISSVVRLKDLIDYEKNKVKEIKAEIAFCVRERPFDTDSRIALAKSLDKHLERVTFLKASEVIVNNPEFTPEEKKKTETEHVLRYFKGYSEEGGLIKRNTGFLNKIRGAKFKDLSDELKSAIREDYQKRIAEEIKSKGETVSAGKISARKANNKDREGVKLKKYSYGGKGLTEDAIKRVSEVNAFVANLSEEDKEVYVEALEELSKGGSLKEKDMDMEQYYRARLWSYGDTGKAVEQADRIRAFLEKRPDAKTVIDSYREILGNDFDDHMQYVLKNFPYQHIDQYEAENWYEFDPEWKKHSDRVKKYSSKETEEERNRRIRENEEKPLEQRESEEMRRKADLDAYFEGAGIFARGGFTTFAIEKLKATLTPERIMGKQTEAREHEGNNDYALMTALSEVMDENGLKPEVKNTEKKRTIYKKMVDLNSGYLSNITAKSLLAIAKNGFTKDNFTEDKLQEYDEERLAYYRDIGDRMDKPAADAEKTLAEIQAIREKLEKDIAQVQEIKSNPDAYVAGLVNGGNNDDPIMKVKDLTEEEFNEGAPPKEIVEKVEELQKNVELAGKTG